MLPKNSSFPPIFLVMIMTIILIMSMAVTPAMARGQEGKTHPVIAFYQQYISPVDGERCPMYPSCSAYAHEAVERHGLFMGWIMACDRLVRCGRDETRTSPAIVKGDSRVTFDPVSANDFWWYKKP